MNRNIKKIARAIYHRSLNNSLGKKFINYAFLYRKLSRKYNDNSKAGSYLLKNLNRVYTTDSKLNKGRQIKDLIKNIRIKIPEKGFIYTLDEFKNLNNENLIIDNISIDYTSVVYSNIREYRNYYKSSDVKNMEYIENQLELLDAIELLINREIAELEKSDRTDKAKYIQYLENFKTEKATSFEEGLQRILLINQLLWQTGHALNGLGRLDKILDELYQNNIKNNLITPKEACQLIKEFIKTLHSYYWYKSSALMGDTGQVIILGGKDLDENGEEYYFCNDLTYMFIKSLRELKLPDPKIVLRVSENIPRELLEESVKTISTGIGSPLLSNDDEIINKMIEFGYDKEDAVNYVVSACWEPSALGKGLEQNNINFIVFLKSLNEIFDSYSDEELEDIKDFNTLLELYKSNLEKDAENIIKTVNDIKWSEDPLLSLYIDNCNTKQIDISKGGAKYNNYGITTVSLANTVNSLINIKKLVFENEKYTLVQLNEIRKNNFEDNNIILAELKGLEPHFGQDNSEVIKLSNEITEFLSKIFDKHKTTLGGRFKFGLSAPSYISAGEEITASFDGRLNYEPFSTNISSDSNRDYTSIMRFASQLNYNDNRLNGNVIDLMTSPDIIKDNFEKFTDFIELSIKLKFFQMQMNVIDSETLIDAKANPDLYPNLVVRVWGFSAYFNDLPLNYKDLLIKRALKNEGKLNN